MHFLELVFMLAVAVGAVAIAWQAVCMVFGVGAAKRQAARELQAEQIVQRMMAEAAGPAAALGAKVNPLFAACLAPVMAGKPLQLCKVEAITPHGMGSYVIGVFDAGMFARVLEPVLEKEFPSP